LLKECRDRAFGKAKGQHLIAQPTIAPHLSE
jgi:hypothetical protein